MGGSNCAIVGCPARNNVNRGLSFHALPKTSKNREWRRQLIEKIDRVDASFNPYKATICSRHFQQDCFRIGSKGKRMLIPGSLPTEFMPISIKPIMIETPKSYEQKPTQLVDDAPAENSSDPLPASLLESRHPTQRSESSCARPPRKRPKKVLSCNIEDVSNTQICQQCSQTAKARKDPVKLDVLALTAENRIQKKALDILAQKVVELQKAHAKQLEINKNLQCQLQRYVSGSQDKRPIPAEEGCNKMEQNEPEGNSEVKVEIDIAEEPSWSLSTAEEHPHGSKTEDINARNGVSFYFGQEPETQAVPCTNSGVSLKQEVFTEDTASIHTGHTSETGAALRAANTALRAANGLLLKQEVSTKNTASIHTEQTSETLAALWTADAAVRQQLALTR